MSGFVASGAGRYAPSPTGELHLGNLRTALLAWLAARSSGRRFVIRVEDLDRARDAGTASSQLRDLLDLGIDWDGDPLWQTRRVSTYRTVVSDLIANGQAYECYCSRKDVLSSPSAPHQPPGYYPGTCRRLSESERRDARDRISPRRPAIRVRLDSQGRPLMFRDRICGETRGVVDDFVIMRGDGTVAYNLASVVDDAFQRVDQVVRGDDLLLATPRHIALQRLLGLATPEYAHVPLVLGPTGARLAKRDGAVTLSELREQGQTPAHVLALLSRSLGLSREGERITAADLVHRFDFAKIPRHPWVWSVHER